MSDQNNPERARVPNNRGARYKMSESEGYALNKLDAFVSEQLPGIITRNTPELLKLSADFAAALKFLDESPGVLPEKTRAQTLLNLKMFEAAIVHSGMDAPQSLIRLIDRMAGPQAIASLTYEDLVFTNQEPEIRHESHNGHTFGVQGKTRTRTFTDGKVRETESLFYRNHTAIEGCLSDVLAMIESVQYSFSALPTDELEVRYEDINEKLSAVVGLTQQLGEMPEGHFAQFRRFLTSHPRRGYKGPSGAFTAKIPILEFMLRGESLSDSYRNYIQDNLRYFPQRDREKLESVQRQPSLTNIYLNLGKPPELLPLLENVHEFLKQFRATHYRTIAAQIPEAIRDGGAAGTGGEANPGQFLRERMRQQTPWR